MGNLSTRVAQRYAARKAKHWRIDKAKVSRWLKDHNDPDAQRETARTMGGYTLYRFELVPVSEIEVPAMWHPGRPEPLRERMRAGLPLDPIRLGDRVGGKYQIGDGIHRTNVAVEMGFTLIPAILEEWVETPELLEAAEPEQPLHPVGTWVKMKQPERGRVFGWVDEYVSSRLDRGVRRHIYSIALVDEQSTWPDFIDVNDTEFTVTSAPSWGRSVRERVDRR